MSQDFFLKSMAVLPDRLHPFHALRLTISPMGGKRVETERRKFMRFLAQGTAFAVLRPHFTKLGKIKDISEGGLAFEYIAYERQKENSSGIDIFLSDNGFYLGRIPCKIRYDIKIAERYQTSTDRIERRRCGLQFGELTEEQAAQLKFFLKNHTTATA
jgi:hypothetical protein